MAVFETGTARTASVADDLKVIVFSNTAPIEYTLPTGLAVNTEIQGAGIGSGLITISAGSGATVNGTPGLQTKAQYARFRAYSYAADKWIVDGDLQAAVAGGGGGTPTATGDGYILFNGPHTATAAADVSTGVAGNYLSVATGAFTQPAVDMTVAVRLAVADPTPTALSTIIGKYDTTGNQRSWELRHETSGAFSLQWSSNGTSIVSTTGGLATSSANLAWLKNHFEWIWLAVTMDGVDAATTGSDVRFWTSRDNVETADLVTTWTQLGTTQHAAYTTGFFASTAPLTVGQRALASSQPWKGRVKAVSVRNGIGASGVPGGTEVVGFDTTDIPADAATSFTAGSGQTVTINRAGATSDDIQCVPNTAGTYVQVLSGFFPIGVDLQDATSSTSRNNWNTRGINTFVRANSSQADPTTWSAAVVADGRFKQMRNPRPVELTGTAVPASLLAFMHRDEPDSVSAQITYEALQTEYNTWKAAQSAVAVLINTTGTMNQSDNRYFPAADPDGEASANEPWYRKYYATADWVANSRYPVHAGGAFSLLTDAIIRLGQWQAIEFGKPQFVYIEASDQDSGTGQPAPTAAQVRGQFWAAVCLGVRGVFYFPEQISPTFVNDVTVTAVATEMPNYHVVVASIASALQGPIDPPTVAATCSDTTLMRTWRTSLTQHVFVVHNYSASASNGVTINLYGIPLATTQAEVVGESRNEAITFSGTIGQITDDFPAYTAHVYRLSV